MSAELEQRVAQIAAEQIFSDPSLCRGCEDPVINPLTGGLINLNYITCVEVDSYRPYVITVFPRPIERIQQEWYVRELLPDRAVVPFAKVYKAGIVKNSEGKEQGFMVRQYIPGITLHEALSNSPADETIQGVLYQLGAALSAFHEVRLPSFGKIIGNRIIGFEGKSWQEYIYGQIFRRMNRIDEYPSNLTIGEHSAESVQKLLPALREIVLYDGRLLNDVVESRLVHHDFHFLNVIVNKTGELRLATILDTENITAGDPSIDLVSIESQLNLSAGEYRDLFMRNSYFFSQGYLGHSLRPAHYDELRRLYHISWSLSYFSALLDMDTNIHPITPQVKQYMDRHHYVLSGLSQGASLEDLGIQPLI